MISCHYPKHYISLIGGMILQHVLIIFISNKLKTANLIWFLKLPASLTLTVYSVSYFTPFSTQPNCHECKDGDNSGGSYDGNGDDSFRILWSTFLPLIIFAKHRFAAFSLIYQFEKFMNALLLQACWHCI